MGSLELVRHRFSVLGVRLNQNVKIVGVNNLYGYETWLAGHYCDVECGLPVDLIDTERWILSFDFIRKYSSVLIDMNADVVSSRQVTYCVVGTARCIDCKLESKDFVVVLVSLAISCHRIDRHIVVLRPMVQAIGFCCS